MNNFCVVTNSIKDPDLTFTKEVCAYIADNGGHFSTHPDKDTDCIIVLGGDGTVLQAAGDTLDLGIPLLGINLGTLGYLAEIEKKEWKKALQHVFADEYEIDSRMMLEGEHGGKKKFALNDVVFARSGALRILNYDIYVNGLYLNSFNADGIIFSTPTGSTAYNLSAGGPIVEPGASLIVMTPICPHTLNSRSVVLSGNDKIEVQIGRTSNESMLEAEVDFDGSGRISMKTGDRMRIRKSDKVVRLLRLRRRSFLETLHRKMAD